MPIKHLLNKLHYAVTSLRQQLHLPAWANFVEKTVDFRRRFFHVSFRHYRYFCFLLLHSDISGNYGDTCNNISQPVTIEQVLKDTVGSSTHFFARSVNSSNAISVISETHTVTLTIPNKYRLATSDDTFLKFGYCLEAIIFFAVVHGFTSVFFTAGV